MVYTAAVALKDAGVKIRRVGGNRHTEPQHRVVVQGFDIGEVYRSSRGWAYSSDRYGTGGGGYLGFESRSEAAYQLFLVHRHSAAEVPDAPPGDSRILKTA